MITESSGPTNLAVGAIAAGQPMVRVGAGVQGMSGVAWDDTARTITFSGNYTGLSAGGIRVTQTWNNASGAFVPLIIDVTNTASGSNSRFIECYSSGSLIFSVNRFGNTIGGGYNAGTAPVNAGTLTLGGAGGVFGSGGDVILARDAANALALRNGTSAQTLRAYKTFTSSTNYQRFSANTGATNAVRLSVESEGASAANLALELESSGVAPIRMLDPMSVPSFTVATVPAAASFSTCMIYVTDESGGPVLAVSDGTNWRRVTDRAIIS